MMSSQATVLAVLLSVTLVDRLAAERRTLETGSAAERVLLVHLCDQTGLKPSTVRLIEQEVRYPFSRAGLELVFRPGCPDQPLRGDRPTGARVYLLRELLEPLLTLPGLACRDARRILGIVLTSKGEAPGEVIYISRNAVDSSIRRANIAPAVPKRARALGRVIVHELAHRFLAQTEHSLPGILRGGAIGPRELTRPSRQHFRFGRSEVELLRAVLEDE